jgi:uncharacterized protein YdeI (YjbR/CyaY-like superfamily)
MSGAQHVEDYLVDGCGRCKDYRTPQCKVNMWRDVLVRLRAIVLEEGLEETLKWKQPCYLFNGTNLGLVTCFRDRAVFCFLKGALLPDPEDRLVAAGPNSQSGRYFEFRSLADVDEGEAALRTLIREAIKVELEGKKVAFSRTPEPVPEELQAALDNDPVLAEAFHALTPGRQRSHILHISGAKQSATRANRVEKCRPKILAGKGFLDR